MIRARPWILPAACVLPLLLALSVPRIARAEERLSVEGGGAPLISRFEIEPHGILGWHAYYGNSAGFGGGLRASLVVAHHMFLPRLNDTVAVSFGGDLAYYPDCYWRYYGYYGGYYGNCSTVMLFLPVTLQWNFFLSQHFSVFAEPGITPYFAFFDDPCNQNRIPGQYCPSHAGLDVAFFVGGRWHFSDGASLTVRIGYPYISVGVSFY